MYASSYQLMWQHKWILQALLCSSNLFALQKYVQFIIWTKRSHQKRTIWIKALFEKMWHFQLEVLQLLMQSKTIPEMDNSYYNCGHLFSLYWSESLQIKNTPKITLKVDTSNENSIQQVCSSCSKMSNSNYLQWLQ
jgi:hypothetical protein